jgi:nucleolin
VGDDGRSKGIAYVLFSDSSEVEKACELHGQELGGRWLKIEQASNRTERVYDAPVKPEGECYTIFIGNLSWSVDEDAIRSAFESCGTITSVRFATDRETGEFRGFGHVEFEEGDAAEKGVGMAGMDIGGRPVRCDYAQSRGGGGKGGASPGGKGKGGKGGFSPGGKGKGGKGKGKGKGKGGKGKGDAPQRQSSSVQAFAGKKQTFGDSDSD